MLGLGLSECVLIVAVALFVIQPQSLPAVMRFLGQGFAKLKRAQNQLSVVLEDVSQLSGPQSVDAVDAKEDGRRRESAGADARASQVQARDVDVSQELAPPSSVCLSASEELEPDQKHQDL